MADLIAAAKKEGELNVIALPHDWANYGEIIASFKNKYGLKINEINPDAGSADELEAIKANKDSKGPQAPDVIDVGFAFGAQAKQAGLIQPYKVSTWATIPDNVKDAEGFWYGDYYGVLAFEVNKDVVKNVPQDWSDLLKPEFKGQVALAGDPRKSSQAINAVYAASLGSGGTPDNAAPGLEFFKKLNASGNLVPVIAKPATIAKGETPIAIRWDYNALQNKRTSKGNPPIEVVVPKSGILAGVYVQAISAYAPHPNAAKLWMEYLYSDEGQLLWLKGFAHPIRYNDLVSRKVIPDALAKELPPADLYAKALFPTSAQLDASKKVITEDWDKVVGANIK
jgi:putative spermidine/putrescine transport system substrate-binding protein